MVVKINPVYDAVLKAIKVGYDAKEIEELLKSVGGSIEGLKTFIVAADDAEAAEFVEKAWHDDYEGRAAARGKTTEMQRTMDAESRAWEIEHKGFESNKGNWSEKGSVKKE